jgi:tRNA G18 (ribose-2'-O)-methylase SpoU
MDDFVRHVPDKCEIVGIELTDEPKSLEAYNHPDRAVYLLGGEDRTLPNDVLMHCSSIRKINTALCLNVASAATVVLYDRALKAATKP